MVQKCFELLKTDEKYGLIAYGRESSVIVKGEFSQCIRVSVSKVALSSTNIPSDYVIYGILLCDLLTINNRIDLEKTVPMVFHLQEQSALSSEIPSSQKRALASVFVDYFMYVGQFCEIPDLLSYVSELKEQRLADSQWSPGIELTREALQVLHNNSFRYNLANKSDCEDAFNSNEVHAPLVQSKITSIILASFKTDHPSVYEACKAAWSREYVIGLFLILCSYRC